VTGFDWRPGEPQRIAADGLSLEAVCHGPSPTEAPTLVVLHEGLGCVALWRDFPQRLTERTGFGVFVWSRGGYGRSDPVALPRPLDYMTREAEASLPPVLDAFGFRHGVLLGHSDGASIAAIYAGRVADPRVLGIVLIAPHFFAEPLGLAAIAKASAAYKTDLRNRLAKYHDNVDVAFKGWRDAWLDPGFVRWDIGDCIDSLRVPALAIQGQGDRYGTARQVDTLVERSPAPVETLWLADCGHSPHTEQPDATLAAVAAFCARLERITAANPGR
jgi:pimeloyl-ACP methyl ester carboxylesterase